MFQTQESLSKITPGNFNFTQLNLNNSKIEIKPEPSLLFTEPSLIPSASSEPSQRSLLLLKHYFGHEKFRSCQWEIISNALNKIDQIVIMSTGNVSFIYNLN